MQLFLVAVAFLFYIVCEVTGHGRLISPAGRSTMWRYGFNTPHNTQDNQLSCGGFGLQYYSNGGKCGFCGDPWNGPRENEAGGLYATGTIAGHYKQGQIITIHVEVTVNHGGWFEFRLCPTNDPEKRVTEECLDRNLLELATGGTQYQLSRQTGTGVYPIDLTLPEELTCTQCVLQWKWKTASNVHCRGSSCCRGCGPQEWFYGCADIAIDPSAGTDNQNVLQPGSQNVWPFFNRETTLKTPMASGKIPDSFVPLNLGQPPFLTQNRKANAKTQS